MDFESFSEMQLVEMYGDLVATLKEKKIIRSKNVTGDLGEYIAISYYTKTKGLPKLQFAPPSTKNIDAISVNGDRYSIKTITTNTTSAFYGLVKDCVFEETKPAFEYLIIVQLDDNYKLKRIIELDWKTFFKHKHWHSRVNAYNIILSNSVIEDGKVIFQA